MNPTHDLSALLKERGRELGFSLIGITPAARPETLDQFRDWLQQGFHGEMGYMARREEAYADPSGVMVGVKSVIVAAMNYGPGRATPPGSGRIAAYAQGAADYHDVLRERLKELAAVLHEARPGTKTRIAVDTAPLLERDLARRAGLGWFGKNTLLINKWEGSYFFLGGILTDCELPADAPHETSHCGTCTRCLEACPTQAFVGPHVLDARRCISYLTIELRGEPIPIELRPGMEDWMFGCDVCQQVCPWNRKATPSDEPAFLPAEITNLTSTQFLNLTEEEFSERFAATPLSRPGYINMARNAAIVLGNLQRRDALPELNKALWSPHEVVRDAAIWAIGQIEAASSE
ncbi:tRNA epoxyqueuosine(34) reductase QueG [Planctomicrobium piriforme]|uniref:Epoxyqueuosine reductase n=1 Tax=Planctomicrobium piriforme TaxID=1576369 RepID=A0A1I3CY77_9PLAN|nr:tRNA epoxyqueuosine(34) reductase QueG [Planctomicrobium piriforme]SFH79393.1 epoxyqueuosine reductase [Planctomicrobium piriforme]